MIKGKMHYNNKNIKYKIMIEELWDDYHVIVKSRLGKINFFKTELILDSIPFDSDKAYFDDNYYMKYEKAREDFLNKWNSMSNREIINIAEELIRTEMDKDIKNYNSEFKINKAMKDFNNRGNFYIPKAPNKIPMPKCKPCKINKED